MNFFLYFKGCALLLHLHAEDNVQVFSFFSGFFVVFTVFVEFRCISVFYIIACMLAINGCVDTSRDKIISQFRHYVILAGKVDHWTCLPLFVYHEKGRDLSRFGYFGVIGTESRSYMYNARTVFSGDIIARDHTECLLFQFNEPVVAYAEAFIGMR